MKTLSINAKNRSLSVIPLLLINSTFTTNAYAAGIVGNGVSTSCTETALNTALIGGGAVSFNCGSAPVTINFSQEKVISINTTLDGGTNKITLNGAKTQRLFNLASYINFTIKNLTLSNGYTNDQGAAINAPFANTVNVSHCNFTTNISTKTGEYGGGAIYSGAGDLIIDKSQFTANKASIGGAVRLLNSNLTLTASTFTSNQTINGNSIGAGGAIYIDGAKKDNGTINITGSKFIKNSALAFGGAVFNNLYNNNKTIIKNSSFINNSVGGGSNGQGGAIWSTGDSALGGGWISNSNKTTLTINNTSVTNNTASSQAGGIWLGRHFAGTGITITNSTIANNSATNSGGGGIVLGDAGKLTLTNSTIANNRSNGNYNLGGGLWISDNGLAIITNSTIANNTAKWQAAGIYGGLNVTLKNTILANNIAENGGNNWNVKHNCMNPMTDGGGNIQFPMPTDTSCTVSILIANPHLDVLKNNGGLTQTMALLTGSAARGYGRNCPKIDQRGVARPLPVNTACDSGAFEANF